MRRERRPREDLPGSARRAGPGCWHARAGPATGMRCERSVRPPPVNVSQASGTAAIAPPTSRRSPATGASTTPTQTTGAAADQLGDEQVPVALGCRSSRRASLLAGDVADGRPKLSLERLEIGQLLGPDRALDAGHLVVGQDLAEQLDRHGIGSRLRRRGPPPATPTTPATPTGPPARSRRAR